MIEIETYLRSASGEFLPVDACVDRPLDADYVEGAIRIVINGVEILGVEEWDYIDQLWAYIASMIPKLSATGYASTYFPDQPIELSFQRQGSQVLVSATLNEKTRKASVAMSDFLSALRKSGVEFFTKMSTLLPDSKDVYLEARSELLVG